MEPRAQPPTLGDIWDFLVGLKETTEAGFVRVSGEIGNLQTQVSGLRTDCTSLDMRMARIESWHLDRRFDALERRVERLEVKLLS